MPRSRPRRASSLKAMIFGMGSLVLPDSGWIDRFDARDGRPRHPGSCPRGNRDLADPVPVVVTLHWRVLIRV
jgi:hypothetical protein